MVAYVRVSSKVWSSKLLSSDLEIKYLSEYMYGHRALALLRPRHAWQFSAGHGRSTSMSTVGEVGVFGEILEPMPTTARQSGSSGLITDHQGMQAAYIGLTQSWLM